MGNKLKLTKYKFPPIPYTKQKCCQCNDINDEIHIL